MKKHGHDETGEHLHDAMGTYRGLFNSALAGITVHDADGRITAANDTAEKIFGIPEQELRKKDLDFWTGKLLDENGDPLEPSMFPLNRVAETGEPLEGTVIGLSMSADDDTRWFLHSARPQFNDDGDLVSIITSFVDITERRKMQREVEESENKYRAIVENSHDAIIIYRGDRFLFVNERAMEITGYTEAELYEMDIWQLIHPDDRERVKDIGRRRARGEDIPTTYQVRVVSKDGTVRICEFAVTSIIYRGEYAALGSVRDITRQKKAEEHLQRSEREKTLILDTSPALIAYQDTDHRVIWANRAAAESVDETPEALEGRRCHEIWHQREQPCEDCPIAKAVETGEMQEEETSTSDGRYWLVRGNPVRDEDGTIVGVVETALDITERKQAEEELQKLSAMVMQSSDAMICTDTDFRITYMNDAAEDMYGYRLEEVKGETPGIFNAEPDSDEIQQHIFDTVSSGGTYRDVILNKRKNGSTFYCEMKISPLLDDDGAMRGYMSSQRDVTERKKAEEEMERALEQEKLFKLKAAHHFFNPIAISKGYMAIAMEELPDEHKDTIQQAHDALTRVQRVVENIVKRGEIRE